MAKKTSDERIDELLQKLQQLAKRLKDLERWRKKADYDIDELQAETFPDAEGDFDDEEEGDEDFDEDEDGEDEDCDEDEDGEDEDCDEDEDGEDEDDAGEEEVNQRAN